MSVISLETFRLCNGATSEQFVARDEELLQWRYVHRPGLRRRTTARASNGTWLVETWWDSEQLATELEEAGPITSWRELIEDASYQQQIFTTLD
jgi:hypothetical protein